MIFDSPAHLSFDDFISNFIYICTHWTLPFNKKNYIGIVICHYLGPIEFEEADLTSLPTLPATPDMDKKDLSVSDRAKKEGGAGKDM